MSGLGIELHCERASGRDFRLLNSRTAFVLIRQYIGAVSFDQTKAVSQDLWKAAAVTQPSG